MRFNEEKEKWFNAKFIQLHEELDEKYRQFEENISPLKEQELRPNINIHWSNRLNQSERALQYLHWPRLFIDIRR